MTILDADKKEKSRWGWNVRHYNEMQLDNERETRMLSRRFLTVKEVSEYIGIAADMIYTMVSQRRIPYVKVGRLVKFDQTALDAWLKQKTVMPMPQKTY